jgi:alpha-L-fucosidase 2
VTGPDTNFENAWRKPSGETGCVALGPTGSMQMVRELFRNCLKASSLLGIGTDTRAAIETTLPRLPPMQISPTTGELQEWLEDWERTADCQVLSSWGAVCSAQITPRETPELAAALRRIFDNGKWWTRGMLGSWQGAFQANAYARLHDGDMAAAILDAHLRQSVNPNLLAHFRPHCDWEFDGNLGLTAAICEMLLQSHAGEIEILPALPRKARAWQSGSVRGLRARGGYEVDLEWNEARLVVATVRSLNGNRCRVRYGSEIREFDLAKGETYRWEVASGSNRSKPMRH